MRSIRATLVAACCWLLALNSLSAQQATPADWQAWNFLIGEWTGVGTGQSGQGSGGFTFKPDLQQRVLLRTNYAEYPATKDRAAYRHDDLMVIYHETPASPAQAIYFDNEGHVIRYAVQIDPSAKTAVFLSQSGAGSPRYRLTYSAKAPDAVTIKFEVAPPDKPEQFQTYIEASAKRVAK